MVIVVDLEAEALHEAHDVYDLAQIADLAIRPRDAFAGKLLGNAESQLETCAEEEARPNVNIGSFSAALSCYPIVLQIARSLDLNSLHALSLTCRAFRANLLQSRAQLVRRTLRCVNEEQDPGDRLADGLREARVAWIGVGANGRTYSGGYTRTYAGTYAGTHEGRITSGRVGRCARDLVGECRRCGAVVCRNCTIKTAPATRATKQRHRRLCSTCTSAPLEAHMQHPREPPADTTEPRTPEARSQSIPTATQEAFTTPALTRGPCTCTQTVHLCIPCGNAARSSDTTYMRGWTWRTRYSTHLGGLGTGIGEGNEGVECGRGRDCLGAREVEKEIDCDAGELAGLRARARAREAEEEAAAAAAAAAAVAAGDGGQGQGQGQRQGQDHSQGGWTRRRSGSSYLMQEVEGIGGVVKKKVKSRVRVGQPVKEYEDEREGAVVEYLSREQAGVNRSWCAWCSRVIPGRKDVDSRDVEFRDVRMRAGSGDVEARSAEAEDS